MTKSSNPVIDFAGVQQIGIVVKDVEKTSAKLSERFGLMPWDIFTIDFDGFDLIYHGKPTTCSLKIGRLQKEGYAEIELIQPLEGSGIHKDFLEAHGEGIHHLGWHKVNNLEDFHRAVNALEKEGYPNVMSGEAKEMGIAFAYFDTSKTLHTVLEVVCLPE